METGPPPSSTRSCSVWAIRLIRVFSTTAAPLTSSPIFRPPVHVLGPRLPSLNAEALVERSRSLLPPTVTSFLPPDYEFLLLSSQRYISASRGSLIPTQHRRKSTAQPGPTQSQKVPKACRGLSAFSSRIFPTVIIPILATRTAPYRASHSTCNTVESDRTSTNSGPALKIFTSIEYLSFIQVHLRPSTHSQLRSTSYEDFYPITLTCVVRHPRGQLSRCSSVGATRTPSRSPPANLRPIKPAEPQRSIFKLLVVTVLQIYHSCLRWTREHSTRGIGALRKGKSHKCFCFPFVADAGRHWCIRANALESQKTRRLTVGKGCSGPRAEGSFEFAKPSFAHPQIHSTRSLLFTSMLYALFASPARQD